MSAWLWADEALLVSSAVGAAINLVAYVSTQKWWLSSVGWHLASSLTAVLLSLAGVAQVVPELPGNGIGVTVFTLCIAPLPVTQWWRLLTLTIVRGEADTLDKIDS